MSRRRLNAKSASWWKGYSNHRSERGFPLLLLHGNRASSTMWSPNIATLSREYRVFAVDTIDDLGKSRPAGHLPENSLDFARWLEAVLDGLGLESVHAVGQSYGGYLAFNLALHAPERVNKLVMISPGLTLAPPGWPWLFWGAPMILFPSRWTITRFWNKASVRPFQPDDPYLEQVVLGITSLRSQMVVRPEVRDEDYQRIISPVMLLLGEQEIHYNPIHAFERAKQLMPGLVGEVIPASGHNLTSDQPEIVNAKILEFIQR